MQNSTCFCTGHIYPVENDEALSNIPKIGYICPPFSMILRRWNRSHVKHTQLFHQAPHNVVPRYVDSMTILDHSMILVRLLKLMGRGRSGQYSWLTGCAYIVSIGARLCYFPSTSGNGGIRQSPILGQSAWQVRFWPPCGRAKRSRWSMIVPEPQLMRGRSTLPEESYER